MKQIRMFTIVVAALFMTNMFAQSEKGVPAVKDQLKILAEKLSLSGDQQSKVEPVLRDLHDATQKLVQDKSISQQERLDRVRPLRMQADKKIRAILNDNQQKKLDEYEHGPHPEMHGELHGEQSGTQRPKL